MSDTEHKDKFWSGYSHIDRKRWNQIFGKNDKRDRASNTGQKNKKATKQTKQAS